MRRTVLMLVLGGAMLFACAGVVLAQQGQPSDSKQGGPADSAAENPPSGKAIPGQYIVVLKDGVADPRQIARLHAQKYGAEVLHTYRFALKGYAAKLSDEQHNRLSRDPNVQFISEDREVHAVAQSLPTGIDRIQGDASTQLSGNGSGSVSGPAVAIIDTGSGPHPDLNVAGGTNCSTGRSDKYDDGNGHGTHVAGTVAAKDDSVGVVGVAPGAPIYSVRVLNNAGSGSWSSVACGIDWVTGNAAKYNIKAANMSLGGSGSDDGNCGTSNNDALHRAICGSVAAGVTYAVAAGNESDNAANHVPAAYDEVITVSALADFDGKAGALGSPTCRPDVDDTFADFSNYGQDVDIAAPGVCILSTWKGGGYNTISGTSMATPHVTGAAALYKKTNPSATPARVKSDLQAAQEAGPISGDPDSSKEGIVKVSSF